MATLSALSGERLHYWGSRRRVAARRLLREAAPGPEGALLARDGLGEGGVAGEGGLIGGLFGLGGLLDALLGGALLGGALLGGGLGGGAGHRGAEWGEGLGAGCSLISPLTLISVFSNEFAGKKIRW